MTEKCLSFTLPSGAGGMAAGMTRGGIMKQIREIINGGLIGKNIRTDTKGYEFNVWLENEIDYTTFFLVWEPKNSWQKPTVKDKDYPQIPRTTENLDSKTKTKK